MNHCPVCKGVLSPAVNVVDLKPWEVYQFTWGTAVKKRNGNWTHVFIGEQEICVEKLEVILHENGIEFITKKQEEK